MVIWPISLICVTMIVAPSFSNSSPDLTLSIDKRDNGRAGDGLLNLLNILDSTTGKDPDDSRDTSTSRRRGKGGRGKGGRGKGGRGKGGRGGRGKRRKNGRGKGGNNKNLFKKKGLTYSNNCKCGVSKKAKIVLDSRIVGGVNAKQYAWPWAVSLVDTSQDPEFYYCGGSIITDRHILTAAHCVSSGEQVAVRVGDFKKNKENNVEYLVYGTAQLDPNYNPKTMVNDIAIITLKSTIDFKKYNGKIAPVCLPDPGAGDFVDTPVVAVGWGTQSYGAATQATILQQVDLITVSNKDCESAYKKVSPIDSTMICAIGSTGEGKDSCQGDSGGPLVTLDSRTKTYSQIGVVSWGLGCADKGIPGVYSRVTELFSFIKKKTKKSGIYCT